MLKFVDEYRDVDTCLDISRRIKDISRKKINIMEVCGGHTAAIRKNGIHKLIGENIKLISGPGCPVCVTSMEDIDAIMALSEEKDTVICTFGDLFYVPGSLSSLQEKKAEGKDIRIVYSVYDVLEFAKEEPNKKFIFISIGFETTAPTTAAAVIQAKNEKINNFFTLILNKTMPEALDAVLRNEKSKVHALICPGHVSTITGTDIYKPIVEKLGIPCCISGFEPTDLMTSIYTLTEMCEKGKPELINAYKRAVLTEGNQKAKYIMSETFEKSDASWRGLGVIPQSGLRLRSEYHEFDALKHFNIRKIEPSENSNCLCGEILIGAKTPIECTLYGKACTPAQPKGACMVSSEGACSAWYKYGG